MDTWDCTLGFMDSQILLTAEELGVFAVLAEGPHTMPQVPRRVELEDDRTGPLFVTRSDLNMLVAAKGRERTAQEYKDWIARFGVVTDRIQPTPWG